MNLRPNTNGPQSRANGGAKNLPVRLSSSPPRGGVGVESNGPPQGISSSNPGSLISFDFCNIRGLSSNFSSVEHHLLSAKPHMLLLTETQLATTTSPDPFNVSNYTLYPHFRLKGGLCVYSHVNLPVARIHDLESHNFDVIWLKICISSSTKFFGCVYRSPNSSDFRNFFDYLNETVERVLSSHPFSEVTLVGDFNVHHKDWLLSNVTDQPGIAAYEFATINSLEQLIVGPTRIPDNNLQSPSPSPLDLFLTSHPTFYTPTTHPPLGKSDHNLISVASSFALNPPSNSSNRRLWHFSSARWDHLCDFLFSFPWNDYVFRSVDPSDCASRLSEVVYAGMEAFVPFSFPKSSSNSKPWFDKACSEAIRLRNCAHRQWKDNPCPFTHSNFISARNHAHSKIDKTKSKFLKSKCNSVANDPSSRSFWSLAKQISKNFTPSSFPSLFRPDGSVASSPGDKAAIFLENFASNSSLDDTGVPPPVILPLTEPILPSFFLSVRDVLRALELLDVRKAYGPDGIPPVVLKKCARVLAPILTKLFRLILKTNIFPTPWKLAAVQPIPKKGDPSDPSNYRPIAITSTIAKIFESLLNSKLISHLESHHLLSDHQYGFRSARSCGDLLSFVSHIWSSALKEFGETTAVALDISKAFDRVWHKQLLAKLPSFGIPPNICLLLSSFLTGRSISVKVDGHSSPSTLINSGVPQGSVLSPTLFLLFINDLLSCTSNPIHSYADDSTLHISSRFEAAPSTIQLSNSRNNINVSLNEDLQTICTWGVDNLVNFNSTKTQCTTFSLKRTPFLPHLNFNNINLPPCPSLDILGLSFNPEFVWKGHIASLAKSASQKLGILFRFRKYFTPKQLLALYVGKIRPCMEYCSHIWGNSPGTELLDRVQSKAFRLISSPPLTSALLSLSLRRRVASLSLFYRYYFGRCSLELQSCVPPPLVRTRSTRQASHAHPFSVTLSQSRIDRFSRSFFPSTSRLWNNLPEMVFPAEYNLPVFKSRVNRHLRTINI